MPDQRRLLELALKGLEADRAQIDTDIAEIQRQLGGNVRRLNVVVHSLNLGTRKRRPMSATARKRISEGMKRRYALLKSSTQSSQVKKRQSGGLTPAGRKKLSDMMKARWAAKRKAAR